MKYLLTLITLSTVNASVTELTSTNWDSILVNSGKSGFVKFFAPWCGHCKKLKPDWDKLGNSFTDKSDTVIGTVDCTAENAKELCEKFSIGGYPTLKTFVSGQPEDYQGERSLDALMKHAKSIADKCTILNLEKCTASEKQIIEKYQEMSSTDQTAKSAELEATALKMEDTHEKLLKSLQAQYEASAKELEDYKKSISFDVLTLKMLLNKESDKKKDEL